MQQSLTLGDVLNQIGIFIAVPILAVIAWNVWLSYIQTLFLRSIKWTLIEIKPPKEVFKSPLAMELVLGALYQAGGTGTWLDKYWKGNLRNYFALEIVSIEGTIHFYVRTPEKFRKLIESQIYAQYPQAEVFEVEDYMNRIPDFTKDGPVGLWGINYELSKDDPYPIKTYIDYGLDKAVGSLDEAQRVDPITPTLEFMGSIGLKEYVMFQINLRAATDRHSIKNKDGGVDKNKKWTDKAKAVIKELNAALIEKDAEGKSTARRATKGEGQVVEAIERNANKLGFDAGIRALYVTVDGAFDSNKIAGVGGLLRQYNTTDYNSFKGSGAPGFDFPWQDLFGNKVAKKKKDMLDGYRHRGFFYGSFEFDNISSYFTHPGQSGEKPFVLSTEELATLFHLPGRVVETPSFSRIEATKAEPPANLPI